MKHSEAMINTILGIAQHDPKCEQTSMDTHSTTHNLQSNQPIQYRQMHPQEVKQYLDGDFNHES